MFEKTFFHFLFLVSKSLKFQPSRSHFFFSFSCVSPLRLQLHIQGNFRWSQGGTCPTSPPSGFATGQNQAHSNGSWILTQSGELSIHGNSRDFAILALEPSQLSTRNLNYYYYYYFLISYLNVRRCDFLSVFTLWFPFFLSLLF